MTSEQEQKRKERVGKIIERLSGTFPNAKVALNFSNPLELLVATIMSAQTTDVMVNQLTPKLFSKYKAAQDFADADPEELSQYLYPVSFYRNKAKALIKTGQMLVEKYEGKVPDNMPDLVSLSGVARKTANVVLGNAFHKAEGIAVDTHVIRLSNKLDLTDSKDPVKIEKDLMQIVPKDWWIRFPHMLQLFGRQYCPARPHKCDECPLGDVCPEKVAAEVSIKNHESGSFLTS